MHIKTLAALAATGAVAFGATACGGSDDQSASATPQMSATPVAEIPSLSGQSTAVTLDPGFVKALGTLKLTPAPVGDAKISKAGVASFPIPGRNVPYYKPGTTSPYVQGHDRPRRQRA